MAKTTHAEAKNIKRITLSNKPDEKKIELYNLVYKRLDFKNSEKYLYNHPSLNDKFWKKNSNKNAFRRVFLRINPWMIFLKEIESALEKKESDCCVRT